MYCVFLQLCALRSSAHGEKLRTSSCPLAPSHFAPASQPKKAVKTIFRLSITLFLSTLSSNRFYQGQHLKRASLRSFSWYLHSYFVINTTPRKMQQQIDRSIKYCAVCGNKICYATDLRHTHPTCCETISNTCGSCILRTAKSMMKLLQTTYPCTGYGQDWGFETVQRLCPLESLGHISIVEKNRKVSARTLSHRHSWWC